MDRDRLRIALAVLSGRKDTLAPADAAALGCRITGHVHVGQWPEFRAHCEQIVLDAFAALDARVRALERNAAPATGTVPVIRAPFTPEQVAALNAAQQRNDLHPFTCANRGQPPHPPEAVLVATEAGWVCPWCDYRQGWFHEALTRG